MEIMAYVQKCKSCTDCNHILLNTPSSGLCQDEVCAMIWRQAIVPVLMLFKRLCDLGTLMSHILSSVKYTGTEVTYFENVFDVQHIFQWSYPFLGSWQFPISSSLL